LKFGHVKLLIIFFVFLFKFLKWFNDHALQV